MCMCVGGMDMHTIVSTTAWSYAATDARRSLVAWRVLGQVSVRQHRLVVRAALVQDRTLKLVLVLEVHCVVVNLLPRPLRPRIQPPLLLGGRGYRRLGGGSAGG